MKTSTTAGLIVFLALGFIATMLLLFTPLGFILDLPFKQNPGDFDRKHFDAVVVAVRARGLKPGETVQMRLDDLAVPKSLRPLKANEAFGRGQGAGAGNVWASVTTGGKLKVVIETRDLGHAGEYGFAYSEVPLIASPPGGSGDGGWLELDLPGHLKIVQPSMKIDDHWWEVCYNLD